MSLSILMILITFAPIGFVWTVVQAWRIFKVWYPTVSGEDVFIHGVGVLSAAWMILGSWKFLELIGVVR